MQKKIENGKIFFGGENMQEDIFTANNSKTITLRMSNDMYDKIKKLAVEADRDVSKEIRFIIKKYLEIQEKD